MKRTTIGDVAAAAGVSIATVSRVLNGGPVTEITAAKVRSAADRLKYTPNALTKSIFAGRSSTLGVLIDDLRSPFYTDLMRGIDDVANANGSLVMFSNTFFHTGREVAQVQAMDEQRVRGLIVTSGPSVDERVQRMAEEGTPCVLVARAPQTKGPRLHSVSLNNLAAGQIMAEHLVACGRTSVGVLSAGTSASQVARVDGLRSGLRRHGEYLMDSAVEILDDDGGMVEVDNAIGTLLDNNAGLNAIVCMSGRHTVAAHTALANRSLAIPADMAFLSMDDFAWAAALGITTVAQPAYEMGLSAARFVVENSLAPNRLVFEPELIARTSCGEAG
ncbi:LacI family transcriptional regulator [Leifsonia sp. LS1]|uniref:LacI family DNA-binding transcriptional regulator n=1 Tax=Leifsonia sp. LS1 TaxID=2828483 RepID=UPI001CFCC9B1|nr:LacI family DNA-binding transcriptional regulator [Leifsonia sp. LS1]GIT82048.1 LacI family transcriptional regulator [Leifsonia sp. LS1]